MNIVETCRRRRIDGPGICTPLLIPSFSSRFSTEISDIHRFLSHYLFESSLVSAYDLHYGYLETEHIYTTSIVVVDSGGYEAKSHYDVEKGYLRPVGSLTWSMQMYVDVLSQLQPLGRLVAVSFDDDIYLSLADQLERAEQLVERFPDYAWTFLVKPESPGDPYVNMGRLTESVPSLAKYAVLGITDKELGSTVLARCQNLIALRAALSAQGLEMPIHLFGCMDPPTVLAYFLCGADLFDGLAWLRFPFQGGVPVYGPSATIVESEWAEDAATLQSARWIRNLDYLQKLSRSLCRFCEGHEIEALEWYGPWVKSVIELVLEAGITL